MRTLVLKSKKVTTLTAVSVLALGLFGMSSIAYGTEDEHYKSKMSPTPYQTYQPQYNYTNDRHLKLRSLLQEHAVVAGLVTVNRFDNSPEFAASQQLADQNAQLLAQEVGQKYGSNVQSEFLNLWRYHLVLFVNYADALKANDQAKKDQTVNELDKFIVQLSELIDSKSNLSNEQILPEIQKHVELERAVIEAHAAGDYQTQYAKMHEGYEHAGMMADKLSQ